VSLAEASYNPCAATAGVLNRIRHELTQCSELSVNRRGIEGKSALNSDQTLLARSPKYIVMSRYNSGSAARGQIFGIDNISGEGLSADPDLPAEVFFLSLET